MGQILANDARDILEMYIENISVAGQLAKNYLFRIKYPKNWHCKMNCKIINILRLYPRIIDLNSDLTPD